MTIDGWERTLDEALDAVKNAFVVAVAGSEAAQLGSITIRHQPRPDPNRFRYGGTLSAVMSEPVWGYSWAVSVVEQS